MKKILLCLVAAAALMTVSCSKNDETKPNNDNTNQQVSLTGRWNAAHSAEDPEDIAFVAIFTEDSLDLYVIAWGQHMKGTYSWINGVVKYDIAKAYQAFTDVTYDGSGNMTSWSWWAGNLDGSSLALSTGFDWYQMTAENLEQAKEDFGEFGFNVNGNTAISSLVGLENLIFKKVN